MQTIKKSISMLLVVVMLVSVFAFSASAGVPPLDSSATQNIAMKVEVEHEDGTPVTTVSAGEKITVKIYITAKDPEARIAGGAIQLFWNSDVYDFVSRTYGLSSVDSESLYAVNNTQNSYVNTVAKFTTTEKSYGWNICGNFQVTNKAGTTNANASLIQENAATPFLTVVLKVKEGVADGISAPIGVPETSIAPLNTTRQNYTYIQTFTAASPTVTQNKQKALYSLDTIYSVTTGSAAPTLTLSNKNQIKYIKNDDGSFKEINVRARASINAAELQALVGVTANDDVELKIVEAGFVYGATVDKATAEGVIGGTPAEGYTKKPVTYIQNNGTEYVFTCVTTGLTTDKIASSDYQALAYIILNVGGTQYTFTYDATVDVSPKALYNGTYARANSTYGWSLTAIA